MQAWGSVDGLEFYFRARWTSWTLAITEPGVDPVDVSEERPGTFFRSQTWGAGPYDAGYMPEDEAERIIRMCAAEFLRGRGAP